jgi:hypothetical protein
MPVTKVRLDAAAEAWLDAQTGFKQYLEATETLFHAFSEGWCGPCRGLREAFDSYREALLRESGYSLLEVREVYPPRRPECQ